MENQPQQQAPPIQRPYTPPREHEQPPMPHEYVPHAEPQAEPQAEPKAAPEPVAKKTFGEWMSEAQAINRWAIVKVFALGVIVGAVVMTLVAIYGVIG